MHYNCDNLETMIIPHYIIVPTKSIIVASLLFTSPYISHIEYNLLELLNTML